MNKIWKWLAAIGTAVIGALAAALAIKSNQAKMAKAGEARATAAAEHSAKNAEALAAHSERVDDINKTKEGRDEEIQNGGADSVIADIISGNNDRVPNDG